MNDPSEKVRLARKQYLQSSLAAKSSTIERLMRIGHTPGLSICVLSGGELVFEQGYGYSDIERGIKAAPSTIYPIASITKGFTAAACGILVAEGNLSWDEPISTYLPDLALPNHHDIEQNATLIDILSHRSGLEDGTSPFSGPNGMPLLVDKPSLYRTLNAMDAGQGSFRKAWSYCPPLYSLITCIIERASGMTLGDFLTDRIFQPLGMSSTSLVGTDRDGLVAIPYTATSDGTVIARSVPPEGYKFPFDTSMGIQSSAIDMIQWAQAITLASKSVLQSSLESKKILPQMEAIVRPWCQLPPNPGGSPAYCLGWFLQYGHYIFDDMFDFDGQMDLLDWPCTLPSIKPNQPSRKIIYHSGIGHGFTSSLHIYPDQEDAVVILGNSSWCGDAVDCISRLITATLCDQEIDVSTLEANLKHYTDLEIGRWKGVVSGLSVEQGLRMREKPIPGRGELVGRYQNDERSIEISFLCDEEEVESESLGLGPWIGTAVKFGDITGVSLSLWSFCDDTLCFLPSEKKYQELGMCYMTHWAQYLFHLHYEETGTQVSGLWWQFAADRDGIWFRKTD